METAHDAFLSYAHADNERSYGRVLQLADAIKDEYALASGDELELFVDRKSLRWGELWREQIDSALGVAPLFVAIITPMFLKSPECRRELIEFTSMVTSRGMERLFLPILYIDVPGLSEDSDDEVVALIARTQFLDWRKLRNKKLDSEDHLQAVHELATDLIARRSETSAITRTSESRSPEESTGELEATIVAIDAKLQDWMESVDFDKMAGAQWTAARDVRIARLQRLRANRAPQSAQLATLFQLGNELLPIAEDRVTKAQNYGRLTIELDPLVTRALRLVRLHPEKAASLNSLRDGINEAYLNIEPSESDFGGYRLPHDIIKFNKSLERANELLEMSMIYVEEGNNLVLRWREALQELDSEWQMANTARLVDRN